MKQLEKKLKPAYSNPFRFLLLSFCFFCFSGSGLSSVKIYMPYLAKNHCAQLVAKMSYDDENYQTAWPVENQNTDILKPVKDHIFNIYDFDRVYDKQTLAKLRSQDEEIGLENVIYFTYFDDLTGQLQGVMRVAGLGPSPTEDYIRREPNPNKAEKPLLPVGLEFPEANQVVMNNWPAVELGRLATVEGANRAAIALTMLESAFYYLYGELQLDEFKILAHSADPTTKRLYENFGMKTVAQYGESDFVLVMPVQDAYEKVFLQPYMAYSNFGYETRMAKINEVIEKFPSFWRRAFVQAFKYRAKIQMEHGHFKEAMEDIATLEKLLPNSTNVLRLKLRALVGMQFDFFENFTGSWPNALKLINTFKADKSITDRVRGRNGIFTNPRQPDELEILEAVVYVEAEQWENFKLAADKFRKFSSWGSDSFSNPQVVAHLDSQLQEAKDEQYLLMYLRVASVIQPFEGGFVFDPGLYRYRAKILQKLGKDEIAKKYLKAAEVLEK